VPANESQWIAARTTAFNGAVAHTTPVYVLVDNKSFLDRANLQQNVAKQLKVLDWIEARRLANAQTTRYWAPGLASPSGTTLRMPARDTFPWRPRRTGHDHGIANIAFKVSNVEAARNYYGHVLGYEEFSLSPGRAEGSAETFYYKVNDRQYIEITPGLKDASEDKLMHIGFETTDAQRLRDYLASRGVDVPAKVTEDICGNLSFMVKDPDGHAVEFVQYLPDSIQARNSGNMMPGSRLSDHILHVGIHVQESAKADAFYKDILGFRVLWEGGPVTNRRHIFRSWCRTAANGWSTCGPRIQLHSNWAVCITSRWR